MLNDRSAKASSSRNALSACVAAILGLAAPVASATVLVSNCNDAGVGSLRNAIAGAPSGETVDASGLDGVCSTITVTTGAIAVDKNDLVIKGPGADKLTVTAKLGGHQYASRIFTHSGTGTLHLQDLKVSKGYVLDRAAKGGCIYSKGSVVLDDTTVTGCEAKTVENGGFAVGGGIFAKGALTMKHSTLTFNGSSTIENFAEGGGAYSYGFRAYYSTVAGNAASDTGNHSGNYGGVISTGSGAVYIFNSAIAFNMANYKTGGLGVKGAAKVKIANSTISSNSAKKNVNGGAYISANTIEILNSTISANTAKINDPAFAVGLAVSGNGAGATFVMQSSIIANNLYGSPPATDNDLSATIVVSGSNNLVQMSNASLPAGTIFGKCAFLGPLQDNGGLTLTHALLGHSPALNAGNNTFGAGFDQRGKLSVTGDKNYPRVLGPPGVTPRADIGAYEVNGADKIYDADFDSC